MLSAAEQKKKKILEKKAKFIMLAHNLSPSLLDQVNQHASSTDDNLSLIGPRSQKCVFCGCKI